MLIRYHILRGGNRTTVSLDTTLSALMSIKLKTVPGTPEAHAAIRAWIQQRVDSENDPGHQQYSQWIQSEIMLYLVDKKLSTTYWDWVIEGDGELVYWKKKRKKKRVARAK